MPAGYHGPMALGVGDAKQTSGVTPTSYMLPVEEARHVVSLSGGSSDLEAMGGGLGGLGDFF